MTYTPDTAHTVIKRLRHSLSHGWASGPTAWLSEHVLGVQVIESGCKVIKIEPHLGDLFFQPMPGDYFETDKPG